MARQPEGKIKDACRPIAKENELLFWQIEGKNRNGVPDTLAGREAGGCMLIEFKRPGEQPTEQQWLRIYELREAGQLAWWCDNVAGYRRLVGLDPGGYEVVYPQHILDLIALGTTADEAAKPPPKPKRLPAPFDDDNALARWSKVIDSMGRRDDAI